MKVFKKQGTELSVFKGQSKDSMAILTIEDERKYLVIDLNDKHIDKLIKELQRIKKIMK